MIKEAEIASYLARAKEAEQMALQASDEPVREIWLKIALGYRELISLARQRAR